MSKYIHFRSVDGLMLESSLDLLLAGVHEGFDGKDDPPETIFREYPHGAREYRFVNKVEALGITTYFYTEVEHPMPSV